MDKNKTQFHAFAWPNYEAGGGYDDWLESYDTLGDAKKAVEIAVSSSPCNAGQVVEIADNRPVKVWDYDYSYDQKKVMWLQDDDGDEVLKANERV